MSTWTPEPVATLTDGIEALVLAARREGFRFVDRLIEDHHSGANTFTRPGEVLLCVQESGRMVGIGGLNIDPFDGSGTTGRLRRLYVDPACRGRGVGRVLVIALEAVAVQHFVILRLFTDNSDAARFYLSLGYTEVSLDAKASHRKILTNQQ